MLLNSSTPALQNHFTQNLAHMLSSDELGAFILVLANSMQDAQLQKALSPKLSTIFSQLASKHDIKCAPDDHSVFCALKYSGISQHLSPNAVWKTRFVGENNLWQCSYNPLRSLRPARASNTTFTGLHQPFSEENFHFDKAFLRTEILSEETFENTHLQVMYHKFPFVPYHLLIVIDAAQHRSQHMDQQVHQTTWKLASHIGKNVPGFGIAYNSLGAGASVNHLHIHAFLDNSPLAIEKPIWQHNGGLRQYPLDTARCASMQQTWQLIDQLHQENNPYNLLYRNRACYVIKRKPQGSVKVPAWMPTPGWYETCGGFNLEDQALFESLDSDKIEAGLSLLRN
jgi:diadenosine tetraphosphate (Ap4A) HIT family hydrolase